MNLLSQLRDYELRMRAESERSAEAEDVLPFMYAVQKVRWEVRLRTDGTFRDVQPRSGGDTKGKDLGLPLATPNIVRAGSAAKPRLLMDNAEYVLGFQKKEGTPGVERAKKFHEAYVGLVQACADTTGEPSVTAIASFLAGHDPMAFKEMLERRHPEFEADSNVMFNVDGVNPLELASVQRFWAAQFAQSDTEEEGFTAECMITGEVGPVMEREPVKIKGIQGGQVAGMNFISANAQAFESYGLQASQIAPVKLEVAEQYANGLNRLLADPNTSLKVGGVTYAFWTGAGAVPLVGEALRNPPTGLSRPFGAQKKRDKKARPEEVRQALWGIFTGQQRDLKAGAAFYAVGLTPSGSRIAVRTHLSSTVQEAVDNLAAYFATQTLEMVNPANDREAYDLRTLVSAMYRDINKEHTAPDVDALVQFALTGRLLPLSFLVRLAGRNRADAYRVTRPRAVLTKMVLLSRDWKDLKMDKDTLEALNPAQTEPAYHLGRLLAVLDDIQGNVMRANTTLVDRFYGSMSTTPHAVVGRLIQGSQAHLQKLRKEKPGIYHLKQEELEGVMSRLRDIPAKPLTTAQQALFALGYYHQRAHIQMGIRERTAAKREREAQAADSEPQPIPTEGEQE